MPQHPPRPQPHAVAIAAEAPLTPPDRTRGSAVLHPDAYAWLILVGCLDLMLTWLVLQLGGREINGVANWVLQHTGFAGMTLFKLGVMAGVIGICEFIGRRQPPKARWLIRVAIALSAIPIFWTLPQLYIYAARLL